MSYPKIFPIEPGKDGWAPLYSTPTARLLHLCGLRAKTIKARAETTTAIDWEAPRPEHCVPAWRIDEAQRPLKPSLIAIKTLAKRVGFIHGGEVLRDIVKVHANATTLLGISKRYYGAVYSALMAAVDRPPARALPPPPRKPYA
jgi:hypothetical protein